MAEITKPEDIANDIIDWLSQLKQESRLKVLRAVAGWYDLHWKVADSQRLDRLEVSVAAEAAAAARAAESLEVRIAKLEVAQG